MNNIEQTIEEQLKLSPKEIWSYLSDGQWSKASDTVAGRYGLSPEQTEALKNEVLFVLLGMELQNNFVQNITNSLKVPQPIANGIFQSVNDRILKQFTQFLPTEEELEEISAGGEGLIEDAEGNRDNEQFSSTNFQRGSGQQEVKFDLTPNTQNLKPVPEYNMTEGEPQILKEKFVPPNLPTGKETPFEKKIAEQAGSGVSGIVKKTYSNGDPYREQIS